ncbi:hypothetical protein [Desulfovibrio ferrophilus]|uniref:Uncharacterized protein n=1 Tax=Desulfovibrio ferrophilus TaxID=241368 RepID=A0A2Z6B2S4_9BACT|nr:hypothetical protein [Desulfovibrio ferrophilus]BBD09726.1 uncharacterized protein DFE_3000 [Desulfovibrio ferrophilus]
MKIHPDQLKALEQEQAKTKQAQETDKGFGDLLAKEVGKTEQNAPAQGAVVPPPGAGMLSGQLLAAQAAAGTGETDAGQNVMESLENLVSNWEDYAARVGASTEGQNLRQANGMLESIENGVSDLKSKASGLSTANPELNAMIEEVEIMAVTERIKFNRGDYIA